MIAKETLKETLLAEVDNVKKGLPCHTTQKVSMSPDVPPWRRS
jgi:hypothetical protein